MEPAGERGTTGASCAMTADRARRNGARRPVAGRPGTDRSVRLPVRRVAMEPAAEPRGDVLAGHGPDQGVDTAMGPAGDQRGGIQDDEDVVPMDSLATMEPTTDRGMTGEGVVQFGLLTQAAMETAGERRDDRPFLNISLPVAAAPAVSGGTTAGFQAYPTWLDLEPQWSPPVSGGTTWSWAAPW